MTKWCASYGVDIWAYGLMPNHVHLIAAPESVDSLARGIGEVHRRYTQMTNFRKGRKGYLWQGRFASFPMDEAHLLAAVRYVELNPVRAKLVEKPQDYRWSSARAYLAQSDDEVVKVKPMLDRVENWADLLASASVGCIPSTKHATNQLLALNRLNCSCRLFAPRKSSLEIKMLNDEIVDEVRAIRDAHAAKFGYDLRAIYAGQKKSEADHIATEHPFVSTPSALPAPDSALQRTRFAHR